VEWLALLIPGGFLAGGIAFVVAGVNKKSGTMTGPGGTAPAGPTVLINVGIALIILGLVVAISMIVGFTKNQ
jgi:hypothetical protein